MPPSGVDYASEFLNGYAPEYVVLYARIVLSANQIYYVNVHTNFSRLGCLSVYSP